MYLSSVLILEYFCGQEGEEGWNWGIPFKKLDYWGCISGTRRKSSGVLSPLHHLLGNSAEFNQLAKEKSDKETSSVQGGKGITFAKNKTKQKTFTKLLTLTLHRVGQPDLCTTRFLAGTLSTVNTAHGPHLAVRVTALPHEKKLTTL